MTPMVASEWGSAAMVIRGWVPEAWRHDPSAREPHQPQGQVCLQELKTLLLYGAVSNGSSLQDSLPGARHSEWGSAAMVIRGWVPEAWRHEPSAREPHEPQGQVLLTPALAWMVHHWLAAGTWNLLQLGSGTICTRLD